VSTFKKSSKKGSVIFVGAGPGDPGLLTLKGASVLASADVVLYDKLVNPQLLRLAPQAETIYVGKSIEAKRAKKKRLSHKREIYIQQKKTNRLMLIQAQMGKKVVRLKGGDPFVFGRGAEEMAFLKEHRIRAEVIPGVTSGTAVPAYAGIPITDRRLASSVIFVTAHEDPSKKETMVDWPWLARFQGTIILFMVLHTIDQTTRVLMKNGMSGRRKITFIEKGTVAEQKIVEGTLATITKKVQKADLRAPALAVIGEVNELKKAIPRAIFSQDRARGLEGKTVLVPRPEHQAATLKERLEHLGARVLLYPLIDILPPANFKKMDEAIHKVHDFDWIFFTSANGVHSFFQRLFRLKKDARLISRARIGAIGSATQEALNRYGISPDFIPKRFTTRDFANEFSRKIGFRGKKILLPRADIVTDDFMKWISDCGGTACQLVAYRTRRAKKTAVVKKVLLAGYVDYVVLTSASLADSLCCCLTREQLKALSTRLVSIGPVTSQALRKYGLKPWRQARTHNLDGLMEVLVS